MRKVKIIIDKEDYDNLLKEIEEYKTNFDKLVVFEKKYLQEERDKYILRKN